MRCVFNKVFTSSRTESKNMQKDSAYLLMSAHLSGAAGLFNVADTWSLKLTAIAAFIIQSAALALIMHRKTQAE